jgi:transposase
LSCVGYSETGSFFLKILGAIYHMLSRDVPYNDLGDLYLNKLNKHHLTRNLVHRLERLGYTVTLEQKAA